MLFFYVFLNTVIVTVTTSLVNVLLDFFWKKVKFKQKMNNVSNYNN